MDFCLWSIGSQASKIGLGAQLSYRGGPVQVHTPDRGSKKKAAAGGSVRICVNRKAKTLVSAEFEQ